jgi:hypothetical protein
MHLRERDIGIERLAGPYAAFYEIDRPSRDLGVDQPTPVEVIDTDRAALLALAAFHDLLERDAGRFGRGVRGPGGFVRRPRNAVPFVKTLIVRQASVGAAKMPFAESRCGVADAGQKLCNGDLPLGQTFKSLADRDGVRAGADREAAGHDRRSTRRALRFDVEIGQPRAFGRQPVDTRSRRSPGDPATVNPEFAVAEIVHQDENDIG